MKKKKILYILIICLIYTSSWAQDAKMDILAFQQEQNIHFADKEHSPLPKNKIKKFKGLPFFPINLDYRIEATLVKKAFPKTFKMKTSTKREPSYSVYGTLHFEIEGVKQQLEVYKSEGIGTYDYLFLPFTDTTNGISSYGSGRYLDLEIPKGNTLILDFNKAYNPYCAYNKKYSCPIPPKANRLKIPINAGVKYKQS